MVVGAARLAAAGWTAVVPTAARTRLLATAVMVAVNRTKASQSCCSYTCRSTSAYSHLQCFNTALIRQLKYHVHDGRRIDCQPASRCRLNRILFAPRQRFVESMTETPTTRVTCSCPLREIHFEQNFTFQLQILASSV